MNRLKQPTGVIGHSIIFYHEVPGITAVCDDSDAALESFGPLLQMGFLYSPIAVLQAADQYRETWQWAIAADDNSLDLISLLQRVSGLEEGWVVTKQNWLVSPPHSKLDIHQVLSFVEESKCSPKLEARKEQNLLIPVVTASVLSFALGLLLSLWF